MPTLTAKAEVTGVFVPWNPERMDRRSAKVGWIRDAAGCDIWQGSRDSNGYGQVRDGGRMCLVHRIRYEREIGPTPEGADLDHFFCDNGAGGCCNPFHCRPVAHRENVLRGNAPTAVNAAKTHCPKRHLLSGENLDKGTLARGWRRCRICRNAYDRARRRAYRASHARVDLAITQLHEEAEAKTA